MKELLSTHLPTVHSLAGIARDLLAETRAAATTKASDLRSQVDELWEAAGDMTRPAVRHVGRTIDALRDRDLIVFPRPLKA